MLYLFHLNNFMLYTKLHFIHSSSVTAEFLVDSNLNYLTNFVKI